jgi:hypothetical protein
MEGKKLDELTRPTFESNIGAKLVSLNDLMEITCRCVPSSLKETS